MDVSRHLTQAQAELVEAGNAMREAIAANQRAVGHLRRARAQCEVALRLLGYRHLDERYTVRVEGLTIAGGVGR